MTAKHALRILPPAYSLTPSIALASGQTDLLSQLTGLFYIVVGLTLVAAFLLICAGILLWINRFGTDNNYRDNAIHVMEWAVATLFTLILVLGTVEFIQTHLSATLYVLSIAILLLFAWIVITSGMFSGDGEEKEKR